MKKCLLPMTICHNENGYVCVSIEFHNPHIMVGWCWLKVLHFCEKSSISCEQSPFYGLHFDVYETSRSWPRCMARKGDWSSLTVVAVKLASHCVFNKIIQHNLKQWLHRCSVRNMIPNFRAIKNTEHETKQMIAGAQRPMLICIILHWLLWLPECAASHCDLFSNRRCTDFPDWV